MAWHPTGDKPLPESMLFKFAICGTRGKWVYYIIDHRKHWYILQYPHVRHGMKTMSTLLTLVWEIHRSLVNSLHKVSVMQKFDDFFVIYLSKFWTNNGLAGEFRHLHFMGHIWYNCIDRVCHYDYEKWYETYFFINSELNILLLFNDWKWSFCRSSNWVLVMIQDHSWNWSVICGSNVISNL